MRAADILLPLRLHGARGELSFFSTVTTFGTAVDITLAELTVEAFDPAHAATGDPPARRVRPGGTRRAAVDRGSARAAPESQRRIRGRPHDPALLLAELFLVPRRSTPYGSFAPPAAASGRRSRALPGGRLDPGGRSPRQRGGRWGTLGSPTR